MSGIIYIPPSGGGGVSSAFQTLSGGDGVTNISWDYSLGHNARVTLSGIPIPTANRVLDTPTNVSNGDYGTLVIDSGLLPYTLVLPASFKVVNGGGGVIVLSPPPNLIDVVSWVYDGTNFLVSFGLNFT